MCRKAETIKYVPKVIEVDVYTYDELSEKAKENAYELYREDNEGFYQQLEWDELDSAWQHARKQVQGDVWRCSDYGSVYKPIGTEAPDGNDADIHRRIRDRGEWYSIDLCQAYNEALDERMGQMRLARYILDKCDEYWDEMDCFEAYPYELAEINDQAALVIHDAFEYALEQMGETFVQLDMSNEDYIGTKEWFESFAAYAQEYEEDGTVFDAA